MKNTRIAAHGLVLLGCGKMGSAMLAGWLERGLPASAVWVQDPHPSDWVNGTGVHINAPLPAQPAVVLVAVKPQMMAQALPNMSQLGGGSTVFFRDEYGERHVFPPQFAERLRPLEASYVPRHMITGRALLVFWPFAPKHGVVRLQWVR